MIEKKIYSAVDATEELVGTWGYFGENVKSIELKLEKGSELAFLRKVDGKHCANRFLGECNWQTYPLYIPVCTAENKEAYDAWLNGCPVKEVHNNVSYTYVREGGAEPDFLNNTFVVQKKEKKYVPFDTIAELIEASGVTVNPRGKGSRPFIWLHNKQFSTDWLVVAYNNKSNNITMGTMSYSLEAVFEIFTFLDGSPCGKEV